jgi:hypothetical protein
MSRKVLNSLKLGSQVLIRSKHRFILDFLFVVLPCVGECLAMGSSLVAIVLLVCKGVNVSKLILIQN